MYQTSSTVKSSLFFSNVESQIKLLENSYIDDSIACIVRKKVDNKLTNSDVSLLCDKTRHFSCKEVRCLIAGAIFKVSYRYSFCFEFFMAHIYSTWPPCFVFNGSLGPLRFKSWAEQCSIIIISIKTVLSPATFKRIVSHNFHNFCVHDSTL